MVLVCRGCWRSAWFGLFSTCSLCAAFEDLEVSRGSNAEQTPSPASLCAHPDGRVFVSVDTNGSLGKNPGKGKIVCLVDADRDGKMEQAVTYAEVESPRGLFAVRDQLYVIHSLRAAGGNHAVEHVNLSVFTDANRDNQADGPPRTLVQDLVPAEMHNSRGADHTATALRMGIDGWLYLSVGDYGVVDARGADGARIHNKGGGMLRVRPDGTQLEIYATGLRSVYGLDIDPVMNILARENDDDSGTWKTQLLHILQGADYGYCSTYQNFKRLAMPPVKSWNQGVSTAVFFLEHPGWPKELNKQWLDTDWHSQKTFWHRVEAADDTLAVTQEKSVEWGQITALDMDASGALYASNWAGAGYTGSMQKGYVMKVVPKRGTSAPVPNLETSTLDTLVSLLQGENKILRLHAQQEILHRADPTAAAPLKAAAGDGRLPLASRVAALYTLRQLKGASSDSDLLPWIAEVEFAPHVLRALSDQKDHARNLPEAPLLAALKHPNRLVQIAAMHALTRRGQSSNARDILAAMAHSSYSQPAYQSAVIRDNTIVNIDLDLRGKKELILEVLNGGDGNGNDHADWIEPVVLLEDGTEIKLSLVGWTSATSGWGKTQVNASCVGSPLMTRGGKSIPFGIGTHAPSVIRIDVPESVVRFKCQAALDAGDQKRGSVQFRVFTQQPNHPLYHWEEQSPWAPFDALLHTGFSCLQQLDGLDAVIEALDSEDQDAAWWAIRMFHSVKAVDAVIAKAQNAPDKKVYADALAHLYYRESEFTGTWWGDRPTPSGPYAEPVTWEASPRIANALLDFEKNGGPSLKACIRKLNDRYQLKLPGL